MLCNSITVNVFCYKKYCNINSEKVTSGEGLTEIAPEKWAC